MLSSTDAILWLRKYNPVPGGAGHSRRLVTSDGKVLSRIIQRASRMMDACDFEPSCYKCLRNYCNQKLHDDLSRKSAATFLNGFTGHIDLIEDEDISYEISSVAEM